MIRIDEQLRARILDHAESTYPHECCGGLLGSAGAGHKAVRAIVPIDNRRDGDAARRRFLITADDYRALDARARAEGADVIGFYHSHPDHPARPSDFDREHALPWYSYVIVAVADGRSHAMTSWVLNDDRTGFAEEDVA